MKGLSDFRRTQGLIELERSGEIFRTIKYFRDTKQNIIRIQRRMLFFLSYFYFEAEHRFRSRCPSIRAAPFVHPSRSLSRPNARPETQPADSRVTLQFGFDKRTSAVPR